MELKSNQRKYWLKIWLKVKNIISFEFAGEDEENTGDIKERKRAQML